MTPGMLGWRSSESSVYPGLLITSLLLVREIAPTNHIQAVENQELKANEVPKKL